MKVLFVTPYLPSPPRFGGQRRIHGLMVELARAGHALSVVAFVQDEDRERRAEEITGGYVSRIVAVNDDRSGLSGTRKRLLQVQSLLSRAKSPSVILDHAS